MRESIDPHSIKILADHLQNMPVRADYNPESHQVQYYDELNNKLWYLRLPVQMNWITDLQSPEVRSDYYVILLVQSGSSAMGLFKMNKIIDHKVIKSYMVRKKQGKSQIKHLKTRGKSRAGSRIRLTNTLRFFEDIHERIDRYLNNYAVHRIALSCSKTLLPYLFNKKMELSFTKEDSRIIKIPMHVNVPGHKILLKVHQFMINGEIQINDPENPLIQKISGFL